MRNKMQNNRLDIFVAIFELLNLLNFVVTMVYSNFRISYTETNLQLLLLAERSGRKNKQLCWVKNGRMSEWWNKFVNNEKSQNLTGKKTSMSSSSFEEFCNNMKPYLQRKTTRMRAPISVETQVGSFLYNIDQGHYRKIANLLEIEHQCH